jgi:uncharacterized iron-regulated membrane protein
VFSFPYALIMLCSSGLMMLEEKRHKRIGTPFPKAMSRTVYQAIYAVLILLGITTAVAAIA